MLLPSFFSRENLTGWLSLSTLIKALRTVMELSREKHGRSISLSYTKGVLIASAAWAPGVPCSVGSISGCRKRRRKHRDGHQTHSRSANPFLTFTTTSVFTTAGTEHGVNTVRDGTADYPVENGKGTRAGSVSDTERVSQISTKASKQTALSASASGEQVTVEGWNAHEWGNAINGRLCIMKLEPGIVRSRLKAYIFRELYVTERAS
ncbi:hypothetical protein BGY98DRAFT_938770 [Russula aff. rugulosa BPL654]|nr:hypothetical protein BGY98DRAFT_938770 [Russula aff. rugulosa BPL654]